MPKQARHSLPCAIKAATIARRFLNTKTMKHRLDRKLSQSIASAIVAQGGRVVPFDAEKFSAWQAQNPFSGNTRSAHERWAVDEYFKAA